MSLAVTRQTAYLLLALSLGHVLLISAQVQSGSGMPAAKSVAFGAFARVQQVLAAVADGGRSIWTHYFALRGVVRDNEVLRDRLLDLEGQLQQARAQAAQAQALERALGLRESIAARTLPARVIAGGPSPGALAVTIDRGADDGVRAEMAVIGPNGVVGRVINTPQAHAAQVQLLVDDAAHAAVSFEHSGAGGIVGGGSGDPPLRVDYVPAAANIKPGERVFTTGQDGIYPRGFLVGTVERAERSASGVWTIAVRPAVDFSHIDIVLVVLDKTAGLPPAGRGPGSGP